MFTKIGKLLVTNIKNSVLYEFSVGLIGLIVELVDQNGSMGEYITAVQKAVKNFEAAFDKSGKNPFTAKINEKHEERISLYIALKRQIGVSMKILANPSMVAAAGNLKKGIKECGLWINRSLSYRDATKTIRQILNMLAEEPFAQWAIEASIQTLVERLRTAQNEYEDLKQDRIEDIANDMTPVEKEARKNLIEAVLSTLDAIDFGVRCDNEVFVNLANEIVEMITETNALTRAAETRDRNGETDDAADDEEPDGENAETETEGVTEEEPYGEEINVVAEEENTPEAEGEPEQETSEGGAAYE